MCKFAEKFAVYLRATASNADSDNQRSNELQESKHDRNEVSIARGETVGRATGICYAKRQRM